MMSGGIKAVEIAVESFVPQDITFELFSYEKLPPGEMRDFYQTE